MNLPNTLATHLATLNLFRENNGDVKMTVVEAKGAISELDTRARLTAATPHNYVLALAKTALAPKYVEACERILDMLKQDDGEAFFEAEKFIKRNAPDLYNKLGRGSDMTAMTEGEVKALVKYLRNPWREADNVERGPLPAWEAALLLQAANCLEDTAQQLAAANAREAGLREALIWCSGSQDFQDGGVARKGWLKLCAPLVESAALAQPSTEGGA